MSRRLSLSALFISNILMLGAYSQEQLSAAIRPQLFELLTYQCGVAEVENRFRVAISELGPEVQPLLVSVLTDGLPNEIREKNNDRAANRYDRRAAWLKNNGRELFGEDTDRVAERSRDDYVVDSTRRIEILFQENAIRGLGVIGDLRAAPVVRAAAEKDSTLAILAEQAIVEINGRQ